MKPQEFGALLRDFGAALAAADARLAPGRLAVLADMFDASPASKAADVVKRIDAGGATPGRAGSPTVGEVVPLLSGLRRLLEGRVKATTFADIQAVEAALRECQTLDLNALSRAITEPSAVKSKGSKSRASKPKSPPLRTDLVADYQQKLETSLGDPERFSAVMNQLRSNSEIGKSEIAALAKQMTGSAGRSVEEGLKKIINRHQTLITFKAKSLATGGRSAA
jgi:hypothetical protein